MILHLTIAFAVLKSMEFLRYLAKVKVRISKTYNQDTCVFRVNCASKLSLASISFFFSFKKTREMGNTHTHTHTHTERERERERETVM